jgi:hypothetical protein
MRLRIIFLLVLMASLPFLFGEPQFTKQGRAAIVLPPAPMLPAIPGTKNDWLEIFRTLIGAFAGAGAAFGANAWLQSHARRREEKASGNYAMATLTRQFNGFLQIRLTSYGEIEHAREHYAGAPAWLFVRPVFHRLRDDLHFDFQSLTFLFDRSIDLEAFTSLHEAEQAYMGLIATLDRFNEAAVIRQRKMEELGMEPGSPTTVPELAEKLGPQLVGELGSLHGALVGMCEEGESKYLRASKLLHAALVARFGDSGLIRISPSSPILIPAMESEKPR